MKKLVVSSPLLVALVVGLAACGTENKKKGGTGSATGAATASGSNTGQNLARVSDTGDPTGAEQELLELMNRARKDPTAEGQRLGIDLSSYPAQPPLTHNALLGSAAVGHTDDMIQRGFYGHVNPDGTNANGRVLGTGYDLHSKFGTDPTANTLENVAVGSGNQLNTPQKVHDALNHHAGLATPKHRDAILGKGALQSGNREVGLGYRVQQTSPGQPWEHFCTEEFAVSTTDRPFVTGVVYQDPDGDRVCRIGEGMGGVTVTLSHASGFTVSAQTASAGGYAFEILVDDDYTLSVGGARAQVSVGGDSVKIDFLAPSAGAAPGGSSPAGSTAPVHDLVQAINAERTRNGLAPLTVDPKATAAAEAHSNDMVARGYFSHFSPEGESVDVRLRRAGSTGNRSFAENLYGGSTDSSAILNGWLNSPGHRANVLSPTHTHIGVGTAGNGSSAVATAVFLER